MSAVENFPDTFKKAVQPMVDSQWQASGAALEQFWQTQERALEVMEAFMLGWFKRRHEGAREAIRLVRDMTESEDAMEAATCVQEWARDSAERVAADIRDTNEGLLRLFESARGEAKSTPEKQQEKPRRI